MEKEKRPTFFKTGRSLMATDYYLTPVELE